MNDSSNDYDEDGMIVRDNDNRHGGVANDATGHDEDSPQAMADAAVSSAMAEQRNSMSQHNHHEEWSLEHPRNNEDGEANKDAAVTTHHGEGRLFDAEDHEKSDDQDNDNAGRDLDLSSSSSSLDQKRPSVPSSNAAAAVVEDDVERRIFDLWDDVASRRDDGGGGDDDSSAATDSLATRALDDTAAFLASQVDVLVRRGLEAFHEADRASRECARLRAASRAEAEEVASLRASEERNRATVTELLRAVGDARTSTLDAARDARREAARRADDAARRRELAEARTVRGEAERGRTAAEAETERLKARLRRTLREKMALERDSRAALSLARSMECDVRAGGSGGASGGRNVEFYKRKVKDLEDRCHEQRLTIQDQARKILEAPHPP